MKLPRGVSAARLIRALERLGYRIIRQKAPGCDMKALPFTSSQLPCTIRLRSARFTASSRRLLKGDRLPWTPSSGYFRARSPTEADSSSWSQTPQLPRFEFLGGNL